MKNFLLTPEEKQVAFDAAWIYRKNSVILKVMELLGQLQLQLAAHAATRAFVFPGECLQRGAKISKGERYKELPYVILDYPRLFGQQDIFAFRTMFWWGHYFSCTLHMAGRIKEQYAAALAGSYERAFIKLAKPFPLELWEKMIPEAVACYETLLTVLKATR